MTECCAVVEKVDTGNVGDAASAKHKRGGKRLITY